MSIALGLLLLILFGAFLSLGWSVVTAALRIPVSYPTASTLAISLASVFAASGFVAVTTGRWWKGTLMSLAVVLFNWSAWIFVSSRFKLPEALSLGVLGVNGNQLLWWLLALLVGTLGALMAVGFRFQPPRLGSERPTSIPFVGAVWFLALLLSLAITYGERRMDHSAWLFHSADNSPAALAAYFRQIPRSHSSDAVRAKHRRALSDTDGTQFDLFLYDTGSGIRGGVYDQDQHDAKPCDNRNYSFYGVNVGRSVRAVESAAGIRTPSRLLAVFNGGSFDPGLGKALAGRHLSPLIREDRTFYPTACPAWTFSFKPGLTMRASLRFARSMSDLPNHATYGIAGVQPLIVNGKRARNRIPQKTDGLNMSRTSIAWDGRSRFYVLVVRDPDSESDSLHQAASGKQTGGWNVEQLQSFWRGMRAPYAINLSGGDCAQMAYLARPRVTDKDQVTGDSSYRFMPSSSFGLTAGYLNGRPLRMEVPTLPPYLMSPGSLNYIYLYTHIMVKK